MSRSRPRVILRRPRTGSVVSLVSPTLKSVVGTINWEEKVHTLAEMKERVPWGGGIYIIAKTVKNDPVTIENKPLIPVYVGETGKFKTRWTARLETFGHLFGQNAVPILKAPPYNSFGVYVGRFPVKDVKHLDAKKLRSYREDVEWVLIRYLTETKNHTLNQAKKVTTPILSIAEGIAITNTGTVPVFLEPKIEVASGNRLEVSLNELRAEPWGIAQENTGASLSGNWFRQGRNIVVLLDA